MKNIKRLACLVISIIMMMTIFVGCHEKDEIAFTIGESKFTSAMYSCFLYMSALNAQNDISKFVEESGATTENINYTLYKFDEEDKVSATGTVSYYDYVRNSAIKILRQYALLDAKIKAENLTVDANIIENAKVQASYYWNVGCDANTYQYYASYGADPSSYYKPYNTTFEKNGVAYSTYEKYMVNEYTYNFYFEHLYGEGGKLEIPKNEITSYMNEHLAIGDTLYVSWKDNDNKDLSDEKKAELKGKLEAYANRINAGEAFDIIYKEYQKENSETNNQSSSNSSTTSSEAVSSTESTASGTSSDSTSSEEKEWTPETYTTVFGDSETDYDDKLFADVKKIEIGKAAVIADSDNSRYVLICRGDILKEDYWYKNINTSIRFELKNDEFVKALDAEAATLSLTEDKHATEPFNVKDIKFS